jgi:iron complex outermembrane receptor protein
MNARPHEHILKRHSLALLISLATCVTQAAPREPDLTDLDLATLMSMDVTLTSASRREQSSADAAAAVYVITREEIQRSGATSIPEALRLAPGVQVARINSRGWAVTTRGFSHRFANKLLVMVDGRSIYTPLFSGVFWDEQWFSLDQIDRIEIVRGPGGALWGINAVNGVINIITRRASDVSGLDVHAGSGSIEAVSAGIRYGGRSSALGDFEVHVNRREQDPIDSTDKPQTHTEAGFRIDRPLAEGAFTLQSDFTHGEYGEAAAWPELSPADKTDVGHVSASWQRDTTPGSFEVQTYYSWTERGFPVSWDESALGFEVQFNAKRIGRHVITTGAGYTLRDDRLDDDHGIGIAITPGVAHQQQWNVYAQDEIHFRNDAVRLIVGTKLEHLEFSDPAFEPTLRGLWRITDSQTVWAAASRAVRTPSRAELHSNLQFGRNIEGVPTVVRIDGDERLHAEDLHAYEIGWRWRANPTLSFDISGYHNDYDHMVGQRLIGTTIEYAPQPAVFMSTEIFTGGETHVDGLELASEWLPTSWLHLEAHAAFQDKAEEADSLTQGSVDPKRMFAVRARADLSGDIQADLGWRYVSELTGLDVPGYDSLDTRIAWRPLNTLELSLAVENVLDNEHIEYSDDLRLSAGAVIGRTFFARATWQPRR